MKGLEDEIQAAFDERCAFSVSRPQLYLHSFRPPMREYDQRRGRG